MSSYVQLVSKILVEQWTGTSLVAIICVSNTPLETLHVEIYVTHLTIKKRAPHEL
jgi:hypothetical protein